MPPPIWDDEVHGIPWLAEILGGTAHGGLHVERMAQREFGKFGEASDLRCGVHLVDGDRIDNKRRDIPRPADRVGEDAAEVRGVLPRLPHPETLQEDVVHGVRAAGNRFDKTAAPCNRGEVVEGTPFRRYRLGDGIQAKLKLLRY